jgi:hypothetical protein
VRALALVPLVACGRIGFEPSVTDAQVDASVDAAVDAAVDAPAVVSRAGTVLASEAGSSTTATFPLVAIAAGDVLLLHTACDNAVVATAATVSAPGWTFVQVGSVMGTAPKWGALFGATVPNTTPVTITITWNVTCVVIDGIADEFANADPTPPYDAYSVASGTGNPQGNVQTNSANDLIWAACSSGGTLVGVGAGYTKAADDTHDDWSEYKLTTDPAGTVETATFTAAPAGMFVITTVALKPR